MKRFLKSYKFFKLIIHKGIFQNDLKKLRVRENLKQERNMDTFKNIYLIDKEKLGEENYFRKHFNKLINWYRNERRKS